MNRSDNIWVVNCLSATTPGNDGWQSKNFRTLTTVIRHRHWPRTKSCATRFWTSSPDFSVGEEVRKQDQEAQNCYRQQTECFQMPAKSSRTDYIPTSLLSCSNVFSEIISHFANLSFYNACFLSNFKVVRVTPPIKKPGADKDNQSNYHPMSNLDTISKLLQWLFLSRILPHVISSLNFNPIADPIPLRLPSFSALIICLKLSIDKSPLF